MDSVKEASMKRSHWQNSAMLWKDLKHTSQRERERETERESEREKKSPGRLKVSVHEEAGCHTNDHSVFVINRPCSICLTLLFSSPCCTQPYCADCVIE